MADRYRRESARGDSPISVELAASMANTKITREATTTPRPMYIHHIGHLDCLSAPTELLNDLRRILHQNIARKTRFIYSIMSPHDRAIWLDRGAAAGGGRSVPADGSGSAGAAGRRDHGDDDRVVADRSAAACRHGAARSHVMRHCRRCHRAGRLCAVCRPGHLRVHRQLHPCRRDGRT